MRLFPARPGHGWQRESRAWKVRVVVVPEEMGCGELGAEAAELALGALTGRERARALAHLARCGTCQERVNRLTVTGEKLLGLLPGHNPPPGFEARVLARTALSGAAPGTRDGHSRERQNRGQARNRRAASGEARGWRRMLTAAARALGG